MPEDPDQLVRIKHPDVANLGGPVSRRALDNTWSHLGWTEAPEADVAALVEAEHIATLTGKTVAQVLAEQKARTSRAKGGS